MQRKIQGSSFGRSSSSTPARERMHIEENPGSILSAGAAAPQVPPVRERMHIEENPGSILSAGAAAPQVHPSEKGCIYVEENPGSILSAGAAAPQVHPSEKGCIQRRIQGSSFGRSSSSSGTPIRERMHIEENPGSIFRQERQLYRKVHLERRDAY